jgi:hypothetical protein
VSSQQFAYAQKRRSTRIDQATPLVVQGVGAFREPYQEQVSTLLISCHGCTYQSKYEVIRGEFVRLDVKSSNDGSSTSSSRARVKWVQRLETKDRGFRVAVELEVAGNVWGVASPPDDWFPVRTPEVIDPATSGRELRVVTRTEQQMAPTLDAGSRISYLERNDTAASPIPSLAQLMVGLGEQIQIMASEAATAALIREKSHLLDEFRAQLRDEAAKTVQSVILACKEDLTRRALKELNEAHEANARTNHARWMKKIEQDMESARQQMMIQGTEVSQRIDSMAVSTIEQVQRNMETARGEAVDRFVSRLRDQVAPLLAEAKQTLQILTASEIAFKKESQAIYSGLENQLENSAKASLAKAQDELDKNSAAVAAKTNETLLKLSQNVEKAARGHLQSLLASIGNHLTKTLEERTAEISREFSTGLEGYTRSYLESIGKSIAEIPRNTSRHSHD